MKKLSTLKNLMTNYKTMFKQYKKVYSFEECLYQNKITLRQAIVTDINIDERKSIIRPVGEWMDED